MPQGDSVLIPHPANPAYEVLKEASMVTYQDMNIQAHHYASRTDRRRYNLPSIDKIAVILPGDGHEPCSMRDIVVYLKRLLEFIFKKGRMFKYIIDLGSYKDGSYKKLLKVVQVEDQPEEKHLYYMHHNNMIEIYQITNFCRFLYRRLSECCDLTYQDKEAKFLLESSNRRLGISFEDCNISHVKFLHHDALVIMPKIKKFVIHIMTIDTGSGIEIIFKSTIDQMGLADQVILSDTDIGGLNGSKEE
ncbi:hypothetical protein GIB67_020054 [Kingdonia uniflora]|uniref:Uncharacterized protein n=1 Tax=Kingdonia uniflora TaxID=39325 RepID=A0A7J7L2E1_9MAGN|nr:hypothetical protein GIB67_020054 [Kingdonia uniflora]